MRKFILLFLTSLSFFWIACEDPAVPRQEEYMTLYLPMVQEKSSVLQAFPLVSNTVNYVELDKLSFERDTLLKIGVYCGGMVVPQQEVKIEFALATDSLSSLQQKGVPESSYPLLPEEYYSIASWNVTIPQGNPNGYLEVQLKNTEIPQGGQFILPLKIKSTSVYTLNEAASFILLGINKK